MFFHLRVEQRLVFWRHEAPQSSQNENLVRQILERWHYFAPKLGEVFGLEILAEIQENIFVDVTVHRGFDLKDLES